MLLWHSNCPEQVEKKKLHAKYITRKIHIDICHWKEKKIKMKNFSQPFKFQKVYDSNTFRDMEIVSGSDK